MNRRHSQNVSSCYDQPQSCNAPCGFSRPPSRIPQPGMIPAQRSQTQPLAAQSSRIARYVPPQTEIQPPSTLNQPIRTANMPQRVGPQPAPSGPSRIPNQLRVPVAAPGTRSRLPINKPRSARDITQLPVLAGSSRKLPQIPAPRSTTRGLAVAGSGSRAIRPVVPSGGRARAIPVSGGGRPATAQQIGAVKGPMSVGILPRVVGGRGRQIQGSGIPQGIRPGIQQPQQLRQSQQQAGQLQQPRQQTQPLGDQARTNIPAPPTVARAPCPLPKAETTKQNELDLTTDAFLANVMMRHPDLPPLPSDFTPPRSRTPPRPGIPGWDSPDKPLPKTPPLYYTPQAQDMLDNVEPPAFYTSPKTSPKTPESPPFVAPTVPGGTNFFDLPLNEQDFPATPPDSPFVTPSPQMSPGMQQMLQRLPQSQGHPCPRRKALDRTKIQGKNLFNAPTTQRDVFKTIADTSDRWIEEDAVDITKPTKKTAPPPTMPIITGSPPPLDEFGLPTRIQTSPVKRFIKYDRMDDLYPETSQPPAALPAAPKSAPPYTSVTDVNQKKGVPPKAQARSASEGRNAPRANISRTRNAPTGRSVPGVRTFSGNRAASGGKDCTINQASSSVRPITSNRPFTAQLGTPRMVPGGRGNIMNRNTAGVRASSGGRIATNVQNKSARNFTQPKIPCPRGN